MGIIDMDIIEYVFEDLQIVPGCNVVASGVADIRYSVGEAEPDVGIFHAYVSDIEILGIALDPLTIHESGMMLDSVSPLYKLIEAALMKSESVTEACLQDAEGAAAAHYDTMADYYGGERHHW